MELFWPAGYRYTIARFSVVMYTCIYNIDLHIFPPKC